MVSEFLEPLATARKGTLEVISTDDFLSKCDSHNEKIRKPKISSKIVAEESKSKSGRVITADQPEVKTVQQAGKNTETAEVIMTNESSKQNNSF